MIALLKERQRLSDEKQRELILAAQAGNNDARNEVVECNLPLAIHFAKMTRKLKQNSGLDLDDMVQVAAMGIMRAIAKYNPNKGVTFSSYARWWIIQALQNAIVEYEPIRVPKSTREKVARQDKTTRTAREQLVADAVKNSPSAVRFCDFHTEEVMFEGLADIESARRTDELSSAILAYDGGFPRNGRKTIDVAGVQLSMTKKQYESAVAFSKGWLAWRGGSDE